MCFVLKKKRKNALYFYCIKAYLTKSKKELSMLKATKKFFKKQNKKNEMTNHFWRGFAKVKISSIQDIFTDGSIHDCDNGSNNDEFDDQQ